MTENYKSLNLRREEIDRYVQEFVNDNSLVLRSIELQGNNKKRIVIGRVGIEDATVDLFLNTNGTTTVQFKLGKNQTLGGNLAKHLYETINPDEFISVHYSLTGIYEKDIEPIFEELTGYKDENGKSEFSLIFEQNEAIRKLIKIQSVVHNDTITVTHFKTTNKLTIQGRPLFCYRRIIYLMAELLNLAGLQTVLSRTEENTVEIVRIEVAKHYLKSQLSDAFEDLPNIIQSLLVSGCCVKLASPKLPEYSMLLFPDLRALEGVLRTELSRFGLYTDQEEYGFGAFFEIISGNAKLNENHMTKIDNEGIVRPLENAYTFFRKHRHTLFHMSDFAEASRKIDTLEKALALSQDVYNLLNAIYRARSSKS
jgi:hypothetical protein